MLRKWYRLFTKGKIAATCPYSWGSDLVLLKPWARPKSFKPLKNKPVHNYFTFLLTCIPLYPACTSTTSPVTGVSVPAGGAVLGVIKLIAVTVRLKAKSPDIKNNNQPNHYQFFDDILSEQAAKCTKSCSVIGYPTRDGMKLSIGW